MSGRLVQVIELAGWPATAAGEGGSTVPGNAQRQIQPSEARLGRSAEVNAAFDVLRNRRDLIDEFAGLTWSLEMVDLRTLIAFQRRLAIDRAQSPRARPTNCAELMALAFGPVRAPAHRWLDAVTVQSANPDLQLRPSADGWHFHGGSPFMEVALYAGRAYLRDGYHRAYDLLLAGVNAVPAVMIEAATPEEICPADEWFMPYEVLLGPNPPLLTDFLDASLTRTYERPRLLKTIHLTVTESMEPER